MVRLVDRTGKMGRRRVSMLLQAAGNTVPCYERIEMMDSHDVIVGTQADDGERIPGELSALLTVNDVAGLLACSSRTVYRLADAGRMPRPVKLGALVRWPRVAINEWIAAGCPSCRRARH